MKWIKGSSVCAFAGATLAIALSACSSPSTEVTTPARVVSCESVAAESSGKGPVLECLDGSSAIDVSTLKGPLIINVWGSWCAPCKEEIPIFRSFYAKNKANVEILGVDVEEAKISDGKEFVVSEGMTWPNLSDTDGISRAYFGMGVPVTWFVDSQGKVVFKKIGALKDESELRDLTAKYLNIVVS
ncbi:MAG: TlpA family protein disulfide reductase [Actinobacteria bacterium]|nr:TlpA family protein disulfide reductase [Actinomycetota bacterium]